MKFTNNLMIVFLALSFSFAGDLLAAGWWPAVQQLQGVKRVLENPDYDDQYQDYSKRQKLENNGVEACVNDHADHDEKDEADEEGNVQFFNELYSEVRRGLLTLKGELLALHNNEPLPPVWTRGSDPAVDAIKRLREMDRSLFHSMIGIMVNNYHYVFKKEAENRPDLLEMIDALDASYRLVYRAQKNFVRAHQG